MKTKKTLLGIVAVILFGILPLQGQVSQSVPFVQSSNASTGVSWTAGTVNNGGHPVTVAAGSSTVTLNKADCSSPSFANCNFVIANSSGTVSVTTSLATATASGVSLLALIETGAVTITQVVYPWQSGSLWTSSLGPLTSFSAAPVPATAGGSALGSNALPWASAFFGTAVTNNQQLLPTATSAARVINLGDQGANGAVSFCDQAGVTKCIIFDAHSATAATNLTLADTLSASRTVTFTDPGGAANVAYANPTTAQALSAVSSVTSSTTNAAAAGLMRLGNTDSINWRNAANSNDISLQVNGSNLLVLGGAGVTAPTDGWFFVGPENCSMALTTGTFAANPATSGALSAPAMARAASGNSVLQLTTTAAANTTDVVCEFNVPSRLTSAKGITINDIVYAFGYQTTALTSIGTAAVNSITYSAPGGAAAGTVAAVGGALTVTAGTSHGTPGATTTGGQCYVEKLAFGTPYAVITDNTRLAWQNTFVQSAASATVMQICGTWVHYSNINSL